jgi:RimJ/RimL family protein N-acetyltransferase
MKLETKRLLIRPFVPTDEPDAIDFFTDPDFMVWSLDGALSPDGARAKLHGLIDLYREHGFSKLALEDKASGRLIGYCGFGREDVEGRPVPELGYRLKGEWRGTGLATEAARAVVADAFERLGMDWVLAMVIEENMPSRRVMEKVGLVYQRNVLLHGRELMMHLLERADWEAAQMQSAAG